MNVVKFAAALVLVGGSASAAGINILDPDSDGASVALPTGFNLDDAGNEAPGFTVAGYEALIPVGAGRTGDTVTVFTGLGKKPTNGLHLGKESTVTFTYLGTEADFVNLAIELIGDTVLFQSRTDGSGVASQFGETVSFDVAAGFLPFAYETKGTSPSSSIANNGGTSGPSTETLKIAYGAFFDDAETPKRGKSLAVFFGDSGANVDGDLDDIGVRIDIAPVPLPAAAFMLLAGLGGMAVLGRRRTA